jgi:rhodanese-related sulfurtransferase
MTRKWLILLLLPVLMPWPAQAAPAAGGKPPPGSRDPVPRLSPDTLREKLGGGEEILLIDVRESAGFQQFSIPGSMNIPLFTLKTKSFLKSKSLVLINEGYNSGRLEQEGKRLREAGFTRVSILEGGLASWVQKGGPVRGDVFARRELNRVSPRDFFTGRDSAGRLVVDVSEKRSAESRRLMPRAIWVPYRGETRDFAGRFRKALGEFDGRRLQALLILNRKGEYSERLENLIREASPATVFYLRGGLDSYGTFLRNQTLIRQASQNRKIVKRCATCP